MQTQTSGHSSFIRATALFGSALVALSLPIIASASLAPAPSPCDVVGTPFLTLTQPITEPDSGTNGANWANDSFTEDVNVWLGTDGTTFCAEGTTSGATFVTTGPNSPGVAAVALAPGITGTFTGGETWVFPAGTATTTSATTLTLPADNASVTSQFKNWQGSVFNSTGTGVGASTFYFNYSCRRQSERHVDQC